MRDALARGFTVLESFLTGSYARSTMIAPLKDADIDIFIVLDAPSLPQASAELAACDSMDIS